MRDVSEMAPDGHAASSLLGIGVSILVKWWRLSFDFHRFCIQVGSFYQSLTTT